MASTSFPDPSSESNSNSSSNSFLSHLDFDHILAILLLLPLPSILSLSSTSRHFRSLSLSNSLWQLLCTRDWGHEFTQGVLSSCPVPQRLELDWKRVYQQVSQLNSVSCRRILSKGGAFPKARASHSLNFVSDWLVLFGGGCDGGHHLDDTWISYIGNGSNNVVSWKQVSSGFPSGRFGQSCTLGGDFLVLFGGINDNGDRLNDTWIGHILCRGQIDLKISWRPLEVGSLVPPPRGAHAACCTRDQRLVVHGGIGLYGLRLEDTWVLDLSNDLASGKWYQITNIRPSPPPRSGHSLTWIGGTSMVLFGGRGSEYEVLNDIWLLDIGGDFPKWKELKYELFSIPEEMPLPRVGHSATRILGGKVLIYGGEDSQRHRKDDFWTLDINTLLRFQSMGLRKAPRKLWKKLRVEGHSPSYRSFHGACTDHSGRFVYLFGGMVDGVIQPGEANGLRFDENLYQVELVLQF